MKKKQQKTEVVDKHEEYLEIKELYSTKQLNSDMWVPSNFRLLCAIINVKPEMILSKFMWMVSYSYQKGATEKQRKAAKKFFLAAKFGQPGYSKKDINTMFKELKATRTLYDTTKKMDGDHMELYWKSHHMYTEYWFKQWFTKTKRKDDISILKEF